MTTIHAFTNDQVLSATVLPKVACNNQNTIRLHVDFDAKWDGYGKTAVFYTSKNLTPREVVFSPDNICYIPPEVLTESGHLFIGVKGVGGTEVKASTLLKYKIEVGTPMVVISDPSDGVYNELLDAYGKAVTALEVANSRLDELTKLGEGSTTGDAELVDIRVDVDGVAHANAGGAVRSQVSELRGTLNGDGRTLTASDFQQGTWSGGMFNNSSRIRCLLPIEKGDVVSVDPNGQEVSFVILKEKTGTSGVETMPYTAEPFSWGCKHNGYIVFVVCKDSNQELTLKPEDLAAKITVYRTAHGTANHGKTVCPIQYEIGNIYISDSGFEYRDSTTRVRTPEGRAIPLAKGDTIRLKNYENARFYVGWVSPDGTHKSAGWLTSDFVCAVNAEYVILVCNTVDTEIPSAETLGELIEVQTSISNEFIAAALAENQWQTKEVCRTSKANRNVRAINHRGYNTLAPENTLSAYRISKRMGFDCVECDVQFTSDGAAVLLHDATVDRTSNGTGKISEMTLVEARELDFGSWFSDTFTGEKIPTFEEFILLCKQANLHAYIELKAGTVEQIKGLVRTVKLYGMQGGVSWISFDETLLQSVKEENEKARLGFLVYEINADTIAAAQRLKTDTNEVFINSSASAVTDETAALCAEANLPLEVWTVNNKDTILNLPPYVSGFSSDSLIANEILYDNAALGDKAVVVRGGDAVVYPVGLKGDGVTVASVSETDESGGKNVVTFSDGNTLTVTNGARGDKGDKGDVDDITSHVRITSYGIEQTILGATDNGNTIVIQAEGVLEEGSLYITGLTGTPVAMQQFYNDKVDVMTFGGNFSLENFTCSQGAMVLDPDTGEYVESFWKGVNGRFTFVLYYV